jgi:hypothetical protein
MRLIRVLAGCLILLAGTAAVRADTPSTPLRLIPDQADVLVQIDNPRRLVEAATTAELFQQFQKLDAIRELYDSTNSRRFYQLIAYFEKQLGASWPELLDRVGGGGLAIGLKLGPNPAPALLVLQSKDQETLRKFVKLGLDIIEQELARQDRKERPIKDSYRDIETIHIGDGFFAAVAGSALLISNNAEALHKGLDLHLDDSKASLAHVAAVADARKLVPAQSLAWLWLNMATVHNAPQAKEVFTLPRNDANLTVLFGGLLDVAGRAPSLCAALAQDDVGGFVTLRMGRGREGSQEAMALHIPPAGEGTLPLLEPKGVLYSDSSYFDFSRIWAQRDKLFNEKQRTGMEDVDKRSALFLAGKKMSDLLTELGAHQRFVAVHQEKRGYKTEPAPRLPAFGLVLDLRKKDLGKTLETVLRGAAFLGGNQFKLKLVEEKHGDLTIVSYRFPEGQEKPANVAAIAYNFSPSFVAVGDQFVLSSTIELAHELVDVLQKEAKSGSASSASAHQSRLYADGGADFLKSIDDQLFAQTMLDRALPPDQAQTQVKEFINLVRRLGTLRTEVIYGAQDFRYDFRLVPAK